MQNSIPEKTDDEYEREFQQIYKMFPDAKFDILISLKDMDDIITENSYLIVKNSYNCYHYKDWKKPLIASSRPAEYFIIRGEKITYKYMIEELVKQGLDTGCDHRGLEGYSKCTDNQIELFFGS
jgi:hypothetical protein